MYNARQQSEQQLKVIDSMRCYDEDEVEVVAAEAAKVEEEVERVDRVEEDDAAVDCFAR